MKLTESRETIRQRLQHEASRQWGVDESEMGSFDPLVDLLFGAFSVELEKVRNEIESSRGRTVQRVAEILLPEVLTGVLPSHTVICSKPSGGPAVACRTDQFTVMGRDGLYFTPADDFLLSGATVEVIATGSRIDRIGPMQQREPLLQLPSGNALPAHTCWIGMKIPGPIDTLPLFFNWGDSTDGAGWLTYLPAFKVELAPSVQAGTRPGIEGTHVRNHDDLVSRVEGQVLEIYDAHFLTVRLEVPGFTWAPKKMPETWTGLLAPGQEGVFLSDLYWIKITTPIAVTPAAMDKMRVLTNCFPAVNRELVRQRGKIQPLFNVYGLSGTESFLGIEKVINGDGTELLPGDHWQRNASSNTYTLRNRNIARFDKRDAFHLMTEFASRMRDDLAAFEAMDNSILANHLDHIQKGIKKLNEHLSTFENELPKVYLLVRTKTQGNVLEVYFWVSPGAEGNGIPAFTRLNAVPQNSYKAETTLTLLPSTGGRHPLNEDALLKAFKEAVLTRGRAVTPEDFRAIAVNALSGTGADVQVAKKTDVSEQQKEGVRQILELTIIPDPSRAISESYWLSVCPSLKSTLLQRSTGVLPLFVTVQGFTWRI